MTDETTLSNKRISYIDIETGDENSVDGYFTDTDVREFIKEILKDNHQEDNETNWERGWNDAINSIEYKIKSKLGAKLTEDLE